MKHLVNATDFRNLKETRLPVIMSYLQEVTGSNLHWAEYQSRLTQLALGIEHHRA